MGSITLRQKIIIFLAILTVIAGNTIAIIYYLTLSQKTPTDLNSLNKEDSALPALVITPANNSVLNSQLLTLTGKTFNNAKVTIGNRAVLANEQGEFEIFLNLKTGVNVLNITIEHSNGNTVEEIIYTVQPISAPASSF